MKFIRITDDATTDDIAEAVRNLRIRQRACTLPDARAALADDVDELVQLYCERARAAG